MPADTSGAYLFTSFRWRTSESDDTIPYSYHGYAYALGNPVLWTDPSGRCPNWLAQDCDFAGWDPDTTTDKPLPPTYLETELSVAFATMQLYLTAAESFVPEVANVIRANVQAWAEEGP